jgi:hypothetical protein
VVSVTCGQWFSARTACGGERDDLPKAAANSMGRLAGALGLFLPFSRCQPVFEIPISRPENV